ncbi:methyl-accepting chemotaxis protein [Saccharibacillus alkalitolerans]|uniref:Methyl-accepting chemotaxis protein n=1 Tax=Saccharibacillus alkalitolerans TaxID=2705290 RepID=A0ABX0F9N7_9BACL|nr:methyl-accepting chemotaxis protein [Saccharibacillus alkalitolerans]NGZ77110.1 methyl-accepting chemotaxis protein [Saccharibacillus alkalitolerans]
MLTIRSAIQQTALNTMQKDTQRLAENTAAVLGEQSEAIENVYSGGESTEAYRSLRSQLNNLRLQSGVLYVYMLNKTDSGWIYTVDGAPWDDEEYSQLGTEAEFDADAESELLRGETVNTPVAYSEEWGSLFSSFTPIRDAEGAAIGYLGIDVSAATLEQVTSATLSDTYRIVIPFFAAVLLLSMLVMLLVINRLLKQVAGIKAGLEQAAEGNLDVSVRRITGDQLGDIAKLTEHMTARMAGMIEEIKVGAETLVRSSGRVEETANTNRQQAEEMARAIHEIAAGSMQQAEQTEQASRLTDELGGMMDEVGSYVRQFAGMSEQLGTLQAQVSREHGTLLEKSRGNAHRVDDLTSMSRELNEKTKLAASISGRLNAIVKQTQILSLNAAIEASRAGEAGKGFAVVAGEMGGLAQQSKDSIQEIESILTSFVVQVDRMNEHFEANRTDVRQQELQISECLEAFEAVRGISMQIEELAGRLDRRTADMQDARREVEQHMNDIASATEQTSAMTEEVSASAEEQQRSAGELSGISGRLSELADRMQSAVGQFRTKSSDGNRARKDEIAAE